MFLIYVLDLLHLVLSQAAFKNPYISQNQHVQIHVSQGVSACRQLSGIVFIHYVSNIINHVTENDDFTNSGTTLFALFSGYYTNNIILFLSIAFKRTTQMLKFLHSHQRNLRSFIRFQSNIASACQFMYSAFLSSFLYLLKSFAGG